MNLKIIAAIVLLGTGIGLGITSFRKSMTPYISFAEARQTTGLVQVNGVLADKNYVLRPEEQFLEFQLRDGHGEIMTVEYRGTVPGNFDQATSVVAIGKYDHGRFHAEQLLVKCPSKYQTQAEKGTPTT